MNKTKNQLSYAHNKLENSIYRETNNEMNK
jgi:hypothetical protein